MIPLWDSVEHRACPVINMSAELCCSEELILGTAQALLSDQGQAACASLKGWLLQGAAHKHCWELE